MKYIGPFFRMSTLSQDDIYGQLFHLSKESIKTITLNSKCGIISHFRSSKKSRSSNDNNILDNSSPLLCIYKKSSPNLIHSKTSLGFDETTFRKTILPSTNALMTLSILELSDYFSNYNRVCSNIKSLEQPYSIIAKKQLEFYSNNLRNSDGVFVEKKNISDNNSKSFNLIDKNKDFKFSDQSFMMCAYLLYAINHKDDEISNEYREFAYQILNMLCDFKEEIYSVSFEECCLVLMSLNILLDYEENDDCKNLLIDLSDFLINKFNEKDYYSSSLDYSCLFAINLYKSFKHTEIIYFKEISLEIFDKLESLYDKNKNIFIKLSDKKEIKYSSLEICFYLLSMIIYSSEKDYPTNNHMIANLYKRTVINSGIVCSFPEAPTLDELERYRSLSLKSDDMLNESYFKMPNTPTPESNGLAPIFNKNVTYCRKKDSFSTPKNSFDSNKNMLIYFTFIHFLRNKVSLNMNFKEQTTIDNNTISNEDIVNNNNSYDEKDNSTSLNNQNESIESINNE